MSRTWLVIATFVAVGLSAYLAGAQIDLSASPAKELKQAPGAGQSRTSAVGRSAERRLETVNVQSGSRGIEIAMTTSSPITPRLTAFSDPTRLVIDFPGTVSACRQNRIAVNRDGLTAVRIGVQAGDPPATRVVLDLDQPREYRLINQGDKLIIKLGEPSASHLTPSVTTEPAQLKMVHGEQQEILSTGQTAAATDPSTDPPDPSVDPPAASNPVSSGQSAPEVRPAPESAKSMPVEPGTPVSAQANARDSGESAAKQATEARIAAAVGALPLTVLRTNKEAMGVPSPASLVDPPAGTKASPSSDQLAQLAPAVAPSPVVTPAAQSAVVEAKPSTELRQLKTNETDKLSSDEYVIGEQDVLAITVWREPELSGIVVVRPDGKITVPLVNELKVLGLTPIQLQDLLVEKLKPFVNVPQVTVSVRQINSRNVYLIGEAAREGAFSINSSTTVLQLIAQSGGLKDFAKRKGIYVIRKLGDKQVRYPFNYEEVIRGKNTKQNIVLQPGDMVVVP